MLLPKYDELMNLRRQAHPLGLDARSKVSSLSGGDHVSLFKGRGLDFSEFRAYVPGDDTRSIDWRVTARTGRAHTKIFVEERERSVIVIVDLNHYMDFGTRKTFKSVQAARAAAFISWRANDLHDKTGAILFGNIPEKIKILPAKRSRKSIWQLLETLCHDRKGASEVKIEEALLAANICVENGSSIFIISDFYNPSELFERHLGQLARSCDVTLIQVTDPAEQKLPQAEEVRFADEQGQEFVANTSDNEAGEVYRKEWAKSQETLLGMARQYRVRLVTLSTERDVGDDLLFGIRSLGRRK